MSQPDRTVEWEVVEYEGLTPQQALQKYTPTRPNFRNTLKQLAASVSKSAETWRSDHVAKKLKVGDTLHGYRVTKVFARRDGNLVRRGVRGRPEDLPQAYKSPAPTVIWYAPFVDYQQGLPHASAAARVRICGPLVDERRGSGGAGRAISRRTNSSSEGHLQQDPRRGA